MKKINDLQMKIPYQLSFFMKGNKSIDINLKAVLYAFCFIPFFEISGLWEITGKVVHYGWGLLGLFILIFSLYKNEKSIYLDNFNICFAGYALSILFSAYLNRSISIGMIYSFIVIWVVLQGIHYLAHDILEGLAVVSAFIIVLNALSMFFFHEEVYITSLTSIAGRYAGIVGGRNSFVATILPMGYIVLFYCLDKSREKKYLEKYGYGFWILAMLSIAFARSRDGELILFSATGIVIVGIGAIMCAARNKFQLPKIHFFMLMLFISIMLVGFHNQIVSTKVATTIFEILHRGNDLSQRTYIWDSALEYVRQALVWGSGRGNDFLVSIRSKIFIYSETHNMFLQVLYNGGVVSIIFFVNAFISAFKTNRYINQIKKNIFIAIFCLLIGGLTESIQDKLTLWILLGIINERKFD